MMITVAGNHEMALFNKVLLSLYVTTAGQLDFSIFNIRVEKIVPRILIVSSLIFKT